MVPCGDYDGAGLVVLVLREEEFKMRLSTQFLLWRISHRVRPRWRRLNDPSLLPALEQVAAGAEAADEEGGHQQAEEHGTDDDERERPNAGREKRNKQISGLKYGEELRI